METFAVGLVGEEDRGWLVEAASAEEAIDIVRGTVPRAREVWRGGLLSMERALLGPCVREERCTVIRSPLRGGSERSLRYRH